MKTIAQLAITFFALIIALPVFSDMPQQPLPSSESFDALKALQGTWVGMADADHDGKKESVKLTYRSTSAGSALEETVFAGSSHEMISIYTLNKGKVMMTHYCALGNQPRMQEVSASKSQIKLEKKEVGNMKDPKEPHMGALMVTIKDKDHFEQAWTLYKPDGTTETAVFAWERAK